MEQYKIKELATLIARKALIIKPKTQVYLKYKSEDSINLVKKLMLEMSKRGGIVYPSKFNNEIEDLLLSTITEDSLDPMLERVEFENKKYDIFVSIGSNDAFNKTPKTNQQLIDEYKRRRKEIDRFKRGKQWLLLNYQSLVDAKNIGMNYEDYFRYAMDAMTYDFDPKMDAIIELRRQMAEAKHVKIVGDNVELEFYKNNIPAISLTGNVNLPDGEVYTSPIRESVNGYIKYNVPSPKNSLIFEDIYLVFRNGKVVDYGAKDNISELRSILEIDEGAKYIGEFAFGFNPMINKPMKDILYDEKLCGSFHMALGNSYSNAFNGNRSAIHWDMIYLNQIGNYCDIYFDGKLVFSSGQFVPKLIRGLNK